MRRLEWNDKSTLLDNYRSLGIVANPNVLGARSGYGKTLQLVSLQKPMSAEPPEEYNSDNEPDGMLHGIPTILLLAGERYALFTSMIK